jgi:major membrane immunogen (membrane-anchored lipoprotein)
MDNEITMSEGSKEVESTVKITRKEFEDGSSEEIRVEQVDGGFIKTICKKYKDKDGCWQWDEEKSVHTEDPMRDNSTEGIVSRLEQVLKNM